MQGVGGTEKLRISNNSVCTIFLMLYRIVKEKKFSREEWGERGVEGGGGMGVG